MINYYLVIQKSWGNFFLERFFVFPILLKKQKNGNYERLGLNLTFRIRGVGFAIENPGNWYFFFIYLLFKYVVIIFI